MCSVQQSRRDEIVRFRGHIAELAATVRRCVQLGQATAPRTKLVMRLHAVVTRGCDLQEEVDELDERMRKAGARLGELGLRNTRGDEGMKTMVRVFVEVSALQGEKERKGRELDWVAKRRVEVEREMEALGGCHCQEKMCGVCMELLTQCEECEDVGRAWEEVAKK